MIPYDRKFLISRLKTAGNELVCMDSHRILTSGRKIKIVFARTLDFLRSGRKNTVQQTKNIALIL